MKLSPSLVTSSLLNPSISLKNVSSNTLTLRDLRFSLPTRRWKQQVSPKHWHLLIIVSGPTNRYLHSESIFVNVSLINI
jgi:hypothetical protein